LLLFSRFLKITLKLYASLAEYLPPGAEQNIVKIDVDPEDSIHTVVDAYHVPRESTHLILVNGFYILPEDRDKPVFKEGDVLAIWPPVAGG
jgi:sulfur-carrier protein